MADKGLIAKTTMQAIADAIREKTGETGLMLPSAMAAAIEAISTGAGFPDSVAAMEVQEYISTSGLTSGGLLFKHNLGEKPDMAILFRASSSTPDANEVLYAVNVPSLLSDGTSATVIAWYDSSQYSKVATLHSAYGFDASRYNTEDYIGTFGTTRKFKAGVRYVCMLMKFA